MRALFTLLGNTDGASYRENGEEYDDKLLVAVIKLYCGAAPLIQIELGLAADKPPLPTLPLNENNPAKSNPIPNCASCIPVADTLELKYVNDETDA